MTRLTVLRDDGDLVRFGEPGRFVLTNVSFQGGDPEAVFLNLTEKHCSYRRAHFRELFERDEVPFEVCGPALLLSSEQLSGFQRNFGQIRKRLGNESIGIIPADDPRYEELLLNLQQLAGEIAWVDRLLDTLRIDTDLYRAYLAKPNELCLIEDEGLANGGTALLEQFLGAAATYSLLPELADFNDQKDARVGALGPRGQQFRQWLQEHQTLICGKDSLEYVGYELRPMRMSGRHFQWKHSAEDTVGDIRKLAVDLLCRFRGGPVWCEVKMAGDSNPSIALQQILLYGSMLCSENQISRCQRFYPHSFDDYCPWLGIVVEDQEDHRFQDDLAQTIEYCRHRDVKHLLGRFFRGIVFGVLHQQSAGWSPRRFEVVNWR